MPPSQPQPDSGEIRETILDAAQARLIRFGYHKTTMAEIADDTGMSAANLYRYFANKQDIVAECAARCMDERLERLRAIARDPKRSPVEKLARYALELVDDSHALAGTDSMIGELVDNIARERPAILHAKNAIHYALLGEILNAGNDSGDFAVKDVEACARYLHSAFIMFEVPLFVGLFDRQEFNDRANGLVALLVDGLRAANADPKPRTPSPN